ncbi:MAG TPA: ion transporter, partial [Aquificae bacterium]|nr:ion transporter [Aquificota bacterium]
MTKEKLLKIFMILDIVFTLEIAISFVLSTYNFSFQPFLIKLDLLALFYFLIEFIIKVFLDRKNLKEFFSNFYNLLDSLVILAFLGYLLFDLTSTRALVEIRIINLIRLLVLLRVFKLRKYSQSPFVLNFVTVTTLMFIFSCILWVVESNVNPGIKNFMDAFYFTVITFTTIGYGDIT